MVGYRVVLPSGQEAEAVLFSDGSFHVAEPLCDTWASYEDFVRDWPEAIIAIVGLLVPKEVANV